MCKKEQDYVRWVGSRKICLLFGQYIVDGYMARLTALQAGLWNRY